MHLLRRIFHPGLVLSVLAVIPIVFFTSVSSRFLTESLPGNGKASCSHECIGQYLPAGREDESGAMLLRTISGQYLAVAPLPGSFDH